VLKTAAGNEGTVSSSMLQAGLGSGMGLMMGAHIGQQAGQIVGQLPGGGYAAYTGPGRVGIPGLPPQSMSFYVIINGQQLGPLTFQVINEMIAAGQLTNQSMIWRQGMNSWQSASSIPELSGFFTPPPPPHVTPPPL
jgi:hypothetical protein